MLNASIWLLLIQLANDAELQPSPGQAQSLNDPRVCQYLISIFSKTEPFSLLFSLHI